MYIPIAARQLYSSAPVAQDYIDLNPTLLVSWWCTMFALAIIVTRLCGRFIRTEKLFAEDKVMAWSIIPLLIRMGLVHVILRWGTNNTITTGMSEVEIFHRSVGSRLVLVARIMYAAFLWIAKFTIAVFLKRLYESVWKKSYEVGVRIVRYFLIVTFVAVVISTLTECHNFSHYWQVLPDPGPSCRQGYAQLITMGVSDVITDLVLVGFPIPIILASKMPVKRKISLVLLFGLSLILVAITIYRVFGTIERHSNQQFRSLLASIEILAAAAVSNALVLGSFVRDRGAKKRHFKYGSASASSSVLDKPSIARTRERRNVTSWGSDIDLVSDLGIRLGPELRTEKSAIPRPAPVALPTAEQAHSVTPAAPSWAFPHRNSLGSLDETELEKVQEDELHPSRKQATNMDLDNATPRRMNFFDVGGLLETDDAAMPLPATEAVKRTLTPLPPKSPPPMPRAMSPESTFSFHSAQDFAAGPATPSARHSRRGSLALLQDIGGLLSDDKSALQTPRSRPSSSLVSPGQAPSALVSPIQQHYPLAPIDSNGTITSTKEVEMNRPDVLSPVSPITPTPPTAVMKEVGGGAAVAPERVHSSNHSKAANGSAQIQPVMDVNSNQAATSTPELKDISGLLSNDS